MDLLKLIHKLRQKESEQHWLLALALLLAGVMPAAAQAGLDAGGLTFKDFAVADNGASFARQDLGGSETKGARLLGVDAATGKARIAFTPIRIEAEVPMGWQSGEDAERGTAYSGDRSYRLIVWRVDYAYEGVKNAEHYASEKAGAIQARRKGVKARTQPLGDGSFLIIYENVPPSPGDREPRTVYDVIQPTPGDAKTGVLLTLGVPASQADRGLKLMALLKQNLRVLP